MFAIDVSVGTPTPTRTAPPTGNRLTMTRVLPPFPDKEFKKISPAKLAANRRNGKLSRGPKTEAGKGVSRMNALKHGIFSKLTCPWSRADAEELTAALVEDFKPTTHIQYELISMLATQLLRLRLLRNAEFAALQQSANKDKPTHVRESEYWLDKFDRTASKEERADANEIARQLLMQLEEGVARPKVSGESRYLVQCICHNLQFPEQELAEKESRLAEVMGEIRLQTEQAAVDKLSRDIESLEAEVAELQKLIAENGRVALKIRSVADVRAVLLGKRELSSQEISGWIFWLQRHRQAHAEHLATVAEYEQNVAEYERELMIEAGRQIPQLAQWSNYEAALNKQVDRLLARLAETGCVLA